MLLTAEAIAAAIVCFPTDLLPIVLAYAKEHIWLPSDKSDRQLLIVGPTADLKINRLSRCYQIVSAYSIDEAGHRWIIEASFDRRFFGRLTIGVTNRPYNRYLETIYCDDDFILLDDNRIDDGIVGSNNWRTRSYEIEVNLHHKHISAKPTTDWTTPFQSASRERSGWSAVSGNWRPYVMLTGNCIATIRPATN